MNTSLNMAEIRLKCIKMRFGKGAKILVVDDLLATGGTALAAASLVEKLGGSVCELAFVVNLPEAGGYAKLKRRDIMFIA